jgi:hypothetical protein
VYFEGREGRHNSGNGKAPTEDDWGNNADHMQIVFFWWM